ncbi:MAG TPA: G/U mismatch-specific DNA glycosylase [Parvibaculum sp.]|jgi:TDG/mug DNA glycosylase family protein
MSGSLPDILAKNLEVVFCGINPGVQAAVTGHHFVGRNNRFWNTIHLAGFTPEQISPENDRMILRFRCGLTTVAERATARACELSSHEIISDSAKLERKIVKYRPRYIAFLGKSAYQTISKQRKTLWGAQDSTFGGAAVWVLPNPSGRNLAFSRDALADAYRALRLMLG